VPWGKGTEFPSDPILGGKTHAGGNEDAIMFSCFVGMAVAFAIPAAG